MASNVGPVGPVRKPGTSTSGQPNNQGNGKSNTKKQQPKQPNSIFEQLKKGLNNAQANLNNAYLNEVSQFKSNPGLYLGTRAAGVGGFMPGAVGTGLAAAESYGNTLLNGGSKQDALKNAGITAAATAGIGKVGSMAGKAISKTGIGKAVTENINKQINNVTNLVKNSNRKLAPAVVGNASPAIRNPQINIPVKGEGTSHNIVSKVKDGQTFREGNVYKVYDPETMTYKSEYMSKELADNLNDRVKLQREEGKIPVYSNTGTIHGIPEDVKYADDLINDVNLTEKQQNAHNLDVMNLSYGYDPSIAENVLLSNLNNKAALNAYRMPYGEPLQMSDIYNHYSYEPVETVKRGIVGSRAGDNLNMGGTGAIYLTDDATTLGGFPYKNEFLGPSKDSFIQPYEMGVNDLDPVTSSRLKELASGYDRTYDPEYISNYYLEKPLNKTNPQIGVLQQGAFDANLDNAFNRIIRQGGYAGYQDTHGVWDGRTLEPFQEYGLLRPEDLFYTGTSSIDNKVPNGLRRL